MKEIVVTEENSKIYSRAESFNKRWNVMPNTDSNTMKMRVLSIIAKTVNNARNDNTFDDVFGVNHDFLSDFCNDISMILGIKNKIDFFDRFEQKELYSNINKMDLNDDEEYANFMFFVESVLNYNFKKVNNDDLAFQVAEIFKLSNTKAKILKNNDIYEIYPSNVEFLDKALIYDNLNWLNSYTSTKNHFKIAIKKERKEENYRSIVDELRLSLEFLFKQLFDNKKSLENQIGNVGNYLSDNGISKEISNIYINLLNLYIKYNNEHAKHEDDVKYIEIDYLIYLTGTFMRFILQLEENKKII